MNIRLVILQIRGKSFLPVAAILFYCVGPKILFRFFEGMCFYIDHIIFTANLISFLGNILPYKTGCGNASRNTEASQFIILG